MASRVAKLIDGGAAIYPGTRIAVPIPRAAEVLTSFE